MMAVLRRSCGSRWHLACHALLLLVALPAWHAAANPLGTITSVATSNYNYGVPVKTSYLDPVVCTLKFDHEIDSFNESAWIISPLGAVISNFKRVDEFSFSFLLRSEVNANISVRLPPGAVRDIDGVANSATTANFDVEYFAFPPSVSLRLYGFQSLRTSKVENVAYFTFNSTTRPNGVNFFEASSLSIMPALEIANFEQLSDEVFRFSFKIKFTESSPDPADLKCLQPDGELPSVDSTMFRCSKCPHSERCTMATKYPPSGLAYQEFPFSAVIAPISGLGVPETSFDIMYDTLWGGLELQAPAYAKGPFFLTVVWSEPMDDLMAVMPTFTSGPAVDEAVLQRNLTILGPTSFRMLVAPLGTGALTISINGTKNTVDLVGNANDFRANSLARTGSQVTIVYSGGPPLEGSLSFMYERPAVPYEWHALSGPVVVSPSLTVSWTDFVTATEYDLWVTWGSDFSTPVLKNLSSASHKFESFSALLGIEYDVHLVARNYWGETKSVRKVFLRPRLDVVADGSQGAIGLPSMLSQHETLVTMTAFIQPHTFLSLNSLQVLSFRSIDREAGDSEPCNFNTQTLRCTHLNFHMEVPNTKFLVFRRPVRLQFTYGQQGWKDVYFKPQLRYWESYRGEWMVAADSCPSETRFETWNDLHEIYTVSVCHLTQFAVFELFSPPQKTVTPAIAERDGEPVDVVFFVGLFGTVLGIGLCCTVLWLCKRSGWPKGRINFDKLGIRPVTDRLPSRRRMVAKQRLAADSSSKAITEDSRLMAAVPTPASSPPEEDDVPAVSRAGGEERGSQRSRTSMFASVWNGIKSAAPGNGSATQLRQGMSLRSLDSADDVGASGSPRTPVQLKPPETSSPEAQGSEQRLHGDVQEPSAMPGHLPST